MKLKLLHNLLAIGLLSTHLIQLGVHPKTRSIFQFNPGQVESITIDAPSCGNPQTYLDNNRKFHVLLPPGPKISFCESFLLTTASVLVGAALSSYFTHCGCN